jgi:hypothetical protein
MNWYKKSQEILYHGSKENFDVFSASSKTSVRGSGIFFSNSLEYARLFGNIIYYCNVNLTYPKIYETSLDFTVDEMRNNGTDELYKKLQKDGFDGITILKSKVSTGIIKEVIAFRPQNIKIVNKKIT